MFPVVVAPLDEGVLTLTVHVLCPLTDGVPYILQCGVLQDDDQLRELSVHFADLLPYVRQYLITILLSPFMFGQAGIVDVLLFGLSITAMAFVGASDRTDDTCFVKFTVRLIS